MNGSTSLFPWFKSSFSATGNCVEVRFDGDGVQVRNTRDGEGPVLSFTPTEWSAFLSGVRNDEFNLPRRL